MSREVASSSVEMTNLSFGYANKRLFRELHLSLKAGEITALCGPSGCGKSSLLKLINGLLTPASGMIQVFGQSLDQTNKEILRRQMGYAVQKIGLFPHLTAEANIRLVANTEKRPQKVQDERIDFLLDMFNLSMDLLERYPHELSGGQAQRVGLCRALMLKPKLLLLDEAFSAVDPISRFDIYREFLKLQQAENVTVVLVTHDMREARLLADTIVVMEDGCIIRKGTMDEVIKAPNHPLVARLIREHLLCEV
jgi:osmoprotectant transport system ATP-binding protein